MSMAFRQIAGNHFNSYPTWNVKNIILLCFFSLRYMNSFWNLTENWSELRKSKAKKKKNNIHLTDKKKVLTDFLTVLYVYVTFASLPAKFRFEYSYSRKSIQHNTAKRKKITLLEQWKGKKMWFSCVGAWLLLITNVIVEENVSWIALYKKRCQMNLSTKTCQSHAVLSVRHMFLLR